MRITNDEYTPAQILCELMSPTGISESDTSNFFKDHRLSHDWLLEQWTTKLDVILDCFKRYGSEIAETQFIRDYGVDVRLKFTSDRNKVERIGFQVKSGLEANRDARRPAHAPSMAATLKRQGYEAQRHAGIDEWWIVLGFDHVAHRTLQGAIAAELTAGEDKGIPVRLVRPREAMALLSRSNDEITATCALLLCANDEVLRMARGEVTNLTVSGREIVLSTVGDALEGNALVSLGGPFMISGSYREQRDLLSAVNHLESLGYLSANDGTTFTVNPRVMLGLCALYYEARARHRYGPESASRFLALMTSAPEEIEADGEQ